MIQWSCSKELVDDKIRIAQPYNDLQIESLVQSVLRSGRLVQGELVRRFESEIERYIGTKHAVAVNSGTAAIHTALAAVCSKTTKNTPEVITTPKLLGDSERNTTLRM